jgi:hypothetical protein
MGMNPEEFLILAQQLLQQSSNEAAKRTSVSRSYYGLFNMLTQFLRNNQISVVKTAEAHKKVSNYLFNCGIEEAQLVASHLDDLRDDRNDADYDLEERKFDDMNQVSFTCLKARTAYKEFQQLITNKEVRKNIINGIRDYKKKTNS